MVPKYRIYLSAILLASIFLWFYVLSSRADTAFQITDLELAQRHAPLLFFHQDEIFYPQPIEILLAHARLRQDRPLRLDTNILNSVTTQDLINYKDVSLFLDIWYGSAGSSDYLNYSSHRDFYQENLSPKIGGPNPTTYARVEHDQENQKVIIQYWLFYYYNDWFNKHEGDWEFIQVILDNNNIPEWVVLSQHHGGSRRSWENTVKMQSTHPAVFVALGSHANYFWGNEIYPNGISVGNKKVDILDRTGNVEPTIPDVILLPNLEQLSQVTANLIDNGWLLFNGRWGESAFQPDFGGPLGPSNKGDQWITPYGWGISQPLDQDIWYQNRFRVQVVCMSPTKISITYPENISSPALDTGENYLIYHGTLPDNQPIRMTIESIDQPLSSLTLYLPEEDANTVTTIRYDLNNQEVKNLIASINQPGDITVVSDGVNVEPNPIIKQNVTFEAPDLIWFAGYLPAHQVLFGILFSLIAGILPGLLFTYLVYQIDHFEREPTSLLLATFFWGAIPAILIALIVPIFFNLPPELLGPETMDAIRIGIFSPLIEELVKGGIIIIISVRFKNEFDDTLDGIIYGAFVGLGFAVTGNTISYLGSFLLRGFESLGIAVFTQGFLFGLNHALYSAIFGAGLGFSKQLKSKAKKRLVSIIAFSLAVFANSLHSILINTSTFSIIWAILLNLAGFSIIGIIIFWSQNRQSQIIYSELKEEISIDLCQIISSRTKQRKLLRQTKKQQGKKSKQNLDLQFQLLSELAFKKHEAKDNDSLSEQSIIDNLREKIAELNLKTNLY